MSVGPLVFELIIVFCPSVLLLHHYGRISKQHPVVTFATLIAWYFSLIIVFILPLDVSSTFYRKCLTANEIVTTTIPPDYSNNTSSSIAGLTTTQSMIENSSEIGTVDLVNLTNSTYETIHLNTTTLMPNSSQITTESGTVNQICEEPWSFVPDTTLPVMWRIVYWTSQILTWFLLPFMQSYSCAGDFSGWGKIKRAMIENAVYYGTYLLLFGALLIYVAVDPNLHLNLAQLKVILITASNTWGLFLLVLLLGYGLVELPRGIWNTANLAHTMARTYFQLAKMSTEKQEAIEDLEDILEEVRKVSDIIRYNHPLRKYVNIIVSKCPDDFQSRASQGIDDYQEYQRGRTDFPTEKHLVTLHRRLIRAVHTQKRTNVQWKILMQRALHLEDISKNQLNLNKNWTDEFPTFSESKNFITKLLWTPTIKWNWYCVFQPNLRKLLSLCLAVFSVMVVWSECTFFNESPVLSLFAIFINLAQKNYQYFYIELASCVTISYLCVCAYYTVFRMKVFNYYYIAGHHQTDETSLLFVGIMLCRLTAPLCLNFLGLIHLDTHVTGDTGIETSYTKIMGHLDVISFISDGFNVYFPILVCVLCLATYFNIGQRCLSALGFPRFIDGNDDMTSDLVEEGKQLVTREKRRLQRELNSVLRTERSRGYGHNADMSDRQWKGRNMKKAENELREETDDSPSPVSSNVRNNKIKNDKVELLTDAEPVDYNSVTTVPDKDWNSAARWGSNRPPKNLFDDI